MSPAPTARKLPSVLAGLPKITPAIRDARLPKGVTLADSARDALFVFGPKVSSLADAVAALPSPPPGTARVFVHPEAAREEGLLAKLKPRRVLPLAVRASALLARGYEGIEAAEIDGLAWVWGSGASGKSGEP